VTAPYLVASYPIAASKLPGTEEWAKQAAKHSNGALWNNGTWCTAIFAASLAKFLTMREA
jgi:hypothetical protein